MSVKILGVKRFNPVQWLLLASLLSGAAWLYQPPATVTAQTWEKLYSDVRGLGPLNGVEWQIDAPWRIEPSAATQGHAKIPLTITFHDVRDQDSINRAPFPFGSVCGLYVLEGYTTEGAIHPVTAIDPAHFYEIEASRRWTLDGALTGGPNAHCCAEYGTVSPQTMS